VAHLYDPYHPWRTLLICCMLLVVCALAVVSHVMETPRTVLLVSLCLGTIAGIGDFLIRHRS
jgi:hypothetical protein